MQNSSLIFFKITNNNYTSKYIQNDAGFSMVEVVAVTLMIGILAVIAIPSWFSFINRQQANKANDAIFTAIQQAQREAKQKKISYSFSFKIESNIPKFVIHPDSEQASSIQDQPNDKRWKNLGEDLEIKSGKFTLLTNLSGKNTVDSNNSAVKTNPSYLNNPQTITFDYMGTLPNFVTPATGEATGLKIVVATSNSSTKRCVIIKTILGSTLKGRDNECN